MWEVARDLALDNPPVPSDVLMRLMTGRRGAARQRLFPQLDGVLESMLTVDGQRAGHRGLRRRYVPLGRAVLW